MIKSSHKRIARYAFRFFDVMGPIVVSALSILITSLIVQPVGLLLDPSFSLLANRGVGKIAFTLIVIINILLLLTTLSKEILAEFLERNLYFISRKSWLRPFFLMFVTFFLIHGILLASFGIMGYVHFDASALTLIPKKIFPLLFGFIATFFLAWTEEAIFRGALFLVLRQKLRPFISIVLTSLIFMLAHNLTQPWMLITVDWRLGLGLFLLGMFLNIVYFVTNKLYIGMGIHAGLVYVKVFLRRIPCIEYIPYLPWWINPDLRQSIVTHILFVAVIIVLVILYRRNLSE